MPIRVYDISKKLGLENKEVLVKAKQLGITAARVASSSLDRITGEYLEGELRKDHPEIKAPSESNHALPAPVVSDPVKAVVGTSSPSAFAPTSAVGSGASNKSPAPAKADFLLLPTRPSSDDFFKPSRRFELRVRQEIENHYPYSVLSNVLLFHAERARFSAMPDAPIRSDYAFELDHLLHRISDREDNLILVECKNQSVVVRDDMTWEVQYTDPSGPEGRPKVHNVQNQIERHAYALRSYVNPLARGRRLTIDVLVVSNSSDTPYRVRQVKPWLKIFLLSFEKFSNGFARMQPPPLRVVQSDLLGLLRLGISVPELGHPEPSNAIAYIERCRRDLDGELFRAFEPTKERWAINGSAGMGKSVLLAYSLFVLTTDRKIDVTNNRKDLVNFAEAALQLNLPPLRDRRVYAFALKEKQRQVLEILYRRFVDEFSPLSKDGELGILRPNIRLWTGKIPQDCHVLVIDEAHDLSSLHAKTIADWANEGGQSRYLLVACDRHQKLRLVGRDENIIDGVNFSLKTKKLRLNYRNPFAIYSASLGLMFRWFTKTGPKVVPTHDDLQNGFGFTVERNDKERGLMLSMRNDAHPANSWSDCVSIFPSCDAALARLRPCRFKPQDVLWVRFNDEDEFFDYEQLSCFTYHNLNSPESVELTDKYIKGQDFPIVVIEGFSEDMNDWKTPEVEQRMWQRRKELYVCSSRATAFLFLIPRGSLDGSFMVRDEINELVRQLANPVKDKDGFSRTWRFTISATGESRRMDVFSDATE